MASSPTSRPANSTQNVANGIIPDRRTSRSPNQAGSHISRKPRVRISRALFTRSIPPARASRRAARPRPSTTRSSPASRPRITPAITSRISAPSTASLNGGHRPRTGPAASVTHAHACRAVSHSVTVRRRWSTVKMPNSANWTSRKATSAPTERGSRSSSRHSAATFITKSPAVRPIASPTCFSSDSSSSMASSCPWRPPSLRPRLAACPANSRASSACLPHAR